MGGGSYSSSNNGTKALAGVGATAHSNQPRHHHHHRGVAYDIVEKPAAALLLAGLAGAGAEDGDEAVSPLPSRWNRDDKEAALEVLGEGGVEVRHTGRASSEHEASAVRADHYISPACGVYYFEITVLHKRKDQIK
jgi:hypothetical protein